MWKLILLILVLFLSLMVTKLPDTSLHMKPDPFLFHDFGKDQNGNQIYITYQAYLDMICGHLMLIILTGMIAKDSSEYSFALWSFCGLQVLDLVDFLLCYNSVWVHIGQLPLSMNMVIFTTFFFIVLHQGLKKFEAWMRQ
jgi:hypothetical protein